MTQLKLLSAALIATAMIAGPAMAREHHVAPRQVSADVAGDAYAGWTGFTHACIPAPRVGAFATQPWTNEPPCQSGTGY